MNTDPVALAENFFAPGPQVIFAAVDKRLRSLLENAMNTRYDITNNLSRPVAETGAGRVGSNKAPAADGRAAAGETAPAQDAVKLLSAEVSELARSADSIDHAKVERLRNAIADGSYQVDADAIAEKLLAFEDGLRGTGEA